MWFTGVDWADTHHDVFVIDDVGHQITSFRVAHTPEGLGELTHRLAEVSGPQKKAEMACIVETNHGLLITSLLEAGFAVYPVNPKTVDRKRSASGAKTDKIDAYLLAKHGRSEIADLRRLEPDSPLIAELKALTRDQDGLIQMQTRLVNQLTACLKAYYPVALSLFSQVQQPSTLQFLLTYPTPQEAMSASCEQIAELLIMSLPLPCWTASYITRRRLTFEGKAIVFARNARQECSMIWPQSLLRRAPPLEKHRGRSKARSMADMTTCRSDRKEGQRFQDHVVWGIFNRHSLVPR